MQLLALGALIATCFWILRPFLIAFAWATMVAIATWPFFLHLQAWLGGRRSLAVALMSVALLLVLVVPSYFAVTAIAENAEEIGRWSQALATLAVPQPPAWIESLPVVGTRLAARWGQVASSAPDELVARIAPYGRKLALWFVGQVGSMGLLLLQFLLTVIIVAILYANGETAAGAAERFARRLAGAQGENAVRLAAQAIRSVALGIVVTAIVQSGLAGIGLAVVGAPFAVVLTAIVFVLCILQLGPALVMIPVAVWVYSTAGGLWGTGFLVWALFCGLLDNFLRPLLIRHGADLPLLLVFAGVLGGLIAFGVIGLFVGPVVLAVAYTLLVAWMSEEEPPAPGPIG